MAKARKRTTIADSKPLQPTPDDWMPLTAAFLHIQQVVGGEQLAEEDLRLRLASGDVEAQDRRVIPGEGIDIIPLAPEDFEGPYGLLFSRLPEHISYLHREAHRRDNLLRRVERLRSHGHNFFLRRADVYRIWPIAADAEKQPADTAVEATADEAPQGCRPPSVARRAERRARSSAKGYTWSGSSTSSARPRSASASAQMSWTVERPEEGPRLSAQKGPHRPLTRRLCAICPNWSNQLDQPCRRVAHSLPEAMRSAKQNFAADIAALKG